jgi:hypothetical protein
MARGFVISRDCMASDDPSAAPTPTSGASEAAIERAGRRKL